MKSLTCPTCNAKFSAQEITEGWCDTCGKRIPLGVLAAARGQEHAAHEGSNTEPSRTGSCSLSWCQACGSAAPTKHITFYQNIGMLVLRFQRYIEGWLCKSCIHKYFWQYLTINLLLGWWGVISFCVTPFFILNNVVVYLCCLGMEPAKSDLIR